ncbi:MAG TPA: Rrf2 family transcriptional regulator [Planctomycetota bacterium]|jgi:Rrf2 family protein|nr:Rrf2 family transcriptional regulator [Planctomycetota bacterium]
MRLSKKCEYALRTLIDLGLAQRLGAPVVGVASLARHERISGLFLAQILFQLKRAGYVASKRGKAGGYYLRVPMERVRLGDVVRRMDGALAPIRCASVTAYERCSCPDEEHCGLRLLMLDLRGAISGILDGATLADVVASTLRRVHRDGVRLPFLASGNGRGEGRAS